MSISSFSGPLGAYRDPPLSGAPAQQNPESGPSFFDQGIMLLDPRQLYTFKPGQDFGQKVYGWLGASYEVINQVPSAISAVNIAASQSPGASALTLVSSSGAGITVSTSITNGSTGATVTGLLAIDTAMAGLGFGSATTVNVWDPTKAISRNVRIVSGGNDSGITFLVAGYDIYGFAMSEAITGANVGTASGAKAFKYIASITPSGAAGGTVTVGTGDVIGLPIRADFVGHVSITYNNTRVTASTGFVAAVTTSPATTTTGDVRGTYALQSASDASKRLQVSITVPPANISTSTGITGVTQA